MRTEIKKLWVAALKSGKYKQGSMYLRQTYDGVKEYCCLGVLCDIYSKRRRKYVDWDNSILPIEVMNWAGLQDPNPTVKTKKTNQNCLSSVNDIGGYTFKAIAKLIERDL